MVRKAAFSKAIELPRIRWYFMRSRNGIPANIASADMSVWANGKIIFPGSAVWVRAPLRRTTVPSNQRLNSGFSS